MTDLIERLRAVSDRTNDPLLSEAAAALEAAREALDREAALKGGVEHQRDTLWAELEAAREDAERLDWFAADARMNSGWHEHGTWETPALLVNSTRERCTPQDLRAAIDQARGKGVADA